MVRRNKGIILVVFAVVLLTLFTVAEQGICESWAGIIKKAKKHHAKVESEIKDMTIEQDWVTIASGREMKSTMKMFKKGKKSRSEIKMEMPEDQDMPAGMGAMENTVISDGKDTWQISSFFGKKKISGEESMQYQKDWEWWDLMAEKTKLVGTETVASRKCYVAEGEASDEFPFTKVWIDKKNFSLVKAESKKDRGKEMYFVNSDFRKVKGSIEMPYKTEMFVDGKLSTITTVKSIKTNSDLSDDLFNPDKVESKGFSMQDMMKRMRKQER